MNDAKQYRVFGAKIGDSVTGGKRVAVTDASSHTDFVSVAAASGAPLTAFILARDEVSVTVRFFKKDGAEKLESDSGALVVAHHVGRGCRVVMVKSELTVKLEDGAYWSGQGEHHVLPSKRPEADWLEALQIAQPQRDTGLDVLCAGSLEKHNLIVPIWDDALNRLKPNWDLLSQHLEESGINGAIVAAFGANRSHVNFRFFAPHKGLREDNAGSYSLASLCGYLAPLAVNGVYNLSASQGYVTGKPSSLRAKYIVRDATALAVNIGGTVEEIL